MSGIRDHFDLTPALRELAAKWFFELPADISERDLLRDLLPQVAGVLRADFAAVVKSDQGRWLEIAVAGASRAHSGGLVGRTRWMRKVTVRAVPGGLCPWTRAPRTTNCWWCMAAARTPAWRRR